jgi:hypothetical protein
MQESVNTLNVKNKRRNYANCTCCNNFILLWRKIKIQ